MTWSSASISCAESAAQMARPRTAQRAQSEVGVPLADAALGAGQVALGSESCRYMGHALLGRIE
ncbi:conserved hypothetical protein [Xanthomonas citri pv. citri]|nr:conserved hypothetical protein [Xanthomonas citri pv. citri]